jgi:acyl-CoA synthetase (NDP forming)
MSWPHELERAFHPESVAVVGASNTTNTNLQGGGFISNFQRLGFEGRVYPVNPRLHDILGYKVYPNLTLIPDSLDLVIISTPAADVPAVLEECIAINAKNVHVFTAGFSESGDEEGEILEEEIKEIALRGGLNLIGPNSMGINIPSAKIQTLHGATVKSGPVAFLSQSGGHALQFSHYAQGFGIGFSKIISYGNGSVIDSTDFIEYLSNDDETNIITMYIEGVKDGARLLKQIREANRSKPVIIWKGGLSESGNRAAFSHTGSLAGSKKVWDSFFKQTGAVQVSTLDELADVTMTFLYLSPPHGRNVALLMGGGGRSVTSSDLCSQEGLEIPVFSTETRARLKNLIQKAGTSIVNPIDAESMQRKPDLLEQVLNLAAEDPMIDIVIADLHLNMLLEESSDTIEKVEELLCRFTTNKDKMKPLITILGTWGGRANVSSVRTKMQNVLLLAGIGAYRTLPRACRALSKYIRYHEFQQNNL